MRAEIRVLDCCRVVASGRGFYFKAGLAAERNDQQVKWSPTPCKSSVRTSLAHHEYGDVAIKKRYHGRFNSVYSRKDYDVLQLLDMEHIGKAHTASRKSRSLSAHLYKQHLYYREYQRQPLLNHLWKGAEISCRGSRSADNPQRLPNSCNCR